MGFVQAWCIREEKGSGQGEKQREKWEKEGGEERGDERKVKIEIERKHREQESVEETSSMAKLQGEALFSLFQTASICSKSYLRTILTD